jgi:hypothetical protein
MILAATSNFYQKHIDRPKERQMNEIRQRATEHFPSVLLTLLSMVQALAVELLWSHIRETPYLLELNWTSFIAWVQISATFIGIVLIWIAYSSSAMRFRWVPAISDSVLPFMIGIMEFMLIEALGPEHVSLWFILLATVFALMHWVSHQTMKRARKDPANAGFFKPRKPAVLRDVLRETMSIAGLVFAGLIVLISGSNGVVALLLLFGANALLGWQFYQTSIFWELSIAESPET